MVPYARQCRGSRWALAWGMGALAFAIFAGPAGRLWKARRALVPRKRLPRSGWYRSVRGLLPKLAPHAPHTARRARKESRSVPTRASPAERAPSARQPRSPSGADTPAPLPLPSAPAAPERNPRNTTPLPHQGAGFLVVSGTR